MSKKDKDALGTLQEMKQSHDESKPSFNWPVKVHGLGAGLSMDEIKVRERTVHVASTCDTDGLTACL